MRFLYRTVFLTTLMWLVPYAAAQDSALPDPLFQEFETIEARITAPLSTLVKERPREDYLPGIFQFTAADGSTHEFDVEVRTRGHFRHENCDFPPLWLNFRKSQVEGTLLDKQDKLKLVVHCDDSTRYEQIVLREYLAYRILNAVTDQSFRVRLLRVTYIDSEQKRREQTRYAFLIEHKNRLGKRFDLKDLEIEKTAIRNIQAGKLNLTSVFQLLIGNTDFSPIAGPPDTECCHNYVLFGNAADPIVAIPYDFDQAGLVDAPYASPNEAFRIRTVRQRLYRGRCVNNQHLSASLQKFRDARERIYSLVSMQEGLDSRTRKRVTDYIDGFYEMINDPNDVEKNLVKRCV